PTDFREILATAQSTGQRARCGMALCAASSFPKLPRGSLCRKAGRTERVRPVFAATETFNSGMTREVCMIWLRTLIAGLLCAKLAKAGDWPQWFGLNRDGSSSETIAAWKEAPKVLWRQPVGEGNSSPVVANGRVFVHAKVKD